MFLKKSNTVKILEKNTVGKREEHGSLNIIGKHSKCKNCKENTKSSGAGGLWGSRKNKRYITCRKHQFESH